MPVKFNSNGLLDSWASIPATKPKRWRPKKVKEPIVSDETDTIYSHTVTTIDKPADSMTEQPVVEDKTAVILSSIEVLAKAMAEQNQILNLMLKSSTEKQNTTDVESYVAQQKTSITPAEDQIMYDGIIELSDTWWVIPWNVVWIWMSVDKEYLKKLFEDNYKWKPYSLRNWQKFYIKSFRIQRV